MSNEYQVVYVARSRQEEAEMRIHDRIKEGFQVFNAGVEMDGENRLFWAVLKRPHVITVDAATVKED